MNDKLLGDVSIFSSFPGLLENRNVPYFTSRRSCGNMSYIYGDTADSLANRRNFLEPAGLNYQDLICAKQTHSNNVFFAGKNDLGKGALSYDSSVDNTDAFITNLIEVPLAIFTADCLPVFLYDFKNKAIGLVHASWRSSQVNITAKTVRSMRDKFATTPSDLRVYFGPAIRSCCFQVGGEFNDIFPGQLIVRANINYLDLAGVNRKQLLDCGVKDKNISDSGLCTYCNENDFFSFRREGESCGRMMSVMMLR
ncbi:MAG: peptidoglycan editing factor PgeF [Candidatus Omnitrophota bacterium]